MWKTALSHGQSRFFWTGLYVWEVSLCLWQTCEGSQGRPLSRTCGDSLFSSDVKGGNKVRVAHSYNLGCRIQLTVIKVNNCK